jgi:hypothetical protein
MSNAHTCINSAETGARQKFAPLPRYNSEYLCACAYLPYYSRLRLPKSRSLSAFLSLNTAAHANTCVNSAATSQKSLYRRFHISKYRSVCTMRIPVSTQLRLARGQKSLHCRVLISKYRCAYLYQLSWGCPAGARPKVAPLPRSHLQTLPPRLNET